MEEMQREMTEQRDFYENALEERFNQMEQFESECIELRAQLQMDNNATKGNPQRNWEQRETELRAIEEARVREIQQRVEEIEGQLREAMVLSEKRAEENYTLKQKID